MRAANYVFSIVLIGLCVFLSFFMSALPEDMMMSQTGFINPFSFPKLIAAVLFACAAIIFVQTISRKKTPDETPLFNPAGAGRAAIQLAFAVLYVVSLKAFGFVVSSFLMLLVTNIFLREKRTGKDCLEAAAFAAILTAVAYVGFKVLLNINLP